MAASDEVGGRNQYKEKSGVHFQELGDFELRERGAGPLADPDPAGAPFLLCPAVV